MRFTTITVALLFLSTVIASPIYSLRGGESFALRKRGGKDGPSTSHTTPRRQGSTSGPHSTSGKPAGTKCKRATDSEIIAALQELDQNPIAAGGYGSVHHLKAKIDGHQAVVKIIKGSKTPEKTKIEDEVKNLRQVHQFLGWAHSASTDTYYLVMPYMGMSEKDAKAKGMTQDPKTLTKEAEARYKKDYHMVHGDIDAGGAPGGNLVYKLVSANHYEAEIIDWGMAHLDPEVDPAKVGYSAPVPAAAAITDDHCVHVPSTPKGGSAASDWDFS